MLRAIIDVLVTAGLLFALASAMPGVRLKSYGTAVMVALVYGLLSFFLGTLIGMILFIPMFLSLGLLGLFINALMLWLTDKLVEDFEIDSVKTTLIMAVLLTIGRFVLGVLLNVLL
jgi:putative membrane protein